jgi:hypothetical protein
MDRNSSEPGISEKFRSDRAQQQFLVLDDFSIRSLKPIVCTVLSISEVTEVEKVTSFADNDVPLSRPAHADPVALSIASEIMMRSISAH